MRKLLLAAAATASLALAGCATSDMAPSAGMAGDMTPDNAMGYVTMAAASDLFEIQSSQIALSKAQNAATRDFAQMLIADHTRTTQQLTAAAQASGLTPPPPALMPMQQRMIDELQQAGGSGFDRLYFRQQVPAHEMALALHRNYAAHGDTPALRQVASAAVPVVEEHLGRARTMAR